MNEYVLVEIENRVCRLTLNRHQGAECAEL
jgi:hypothetical protein